MIRRWWFQLRRECRHIFVCRLIDHDLHWKRIDEMDLDAEVYWLRCHRCRRIFARHAFSYTMLRLAYHQKDLVRIDLGRLERQVPRGLLRR